MPTPFTVSGTLQLPPDVGMPNAPIPFLVSNQFDAKVDMELNLVGAGTHTVGFGTLGIPGIKLLLIEVDANPTGAPIYIQLNGGVAGQEEISPGGFKLTCNPLPVAGTTSMQIVYTTNNKVRIRLLG